MPDLLWRRAKDLAQIPARACVRRGFEVQMEGRRYAPGTTDVRFDLYRMYSPLVRGAARAIGRSPQKQEDGDVYRAVDVGAGDGAVRTEVIALQPAGFTGARRWRFTDGDSWSPVVRTVRGIDLGVKAHVGTPPGLPVDGGIEIQATLASGLGDPVVDLSVILPWETESSHGMTVEGVLRDELIDHDGLDEELVAAVLDYAADALPDQMPPGWEVFVQPNALEIDPGPDDGARWWVETRESAVLWIAAGTPGRLALAVHAVDADDPDNVAVSTVVTVERTADGALTVLYTDTDD